MHVVAIVVSVNYTDFLRRSLPLLVDACDVVMVVTQEGDSSALLCEAHGVLCYEYNGWHEKKADFNKSAHSKKCSEWHMSSTQTLGFLLPMPIARCQQTSANLSTKL